MIDNINEQDILDILCKSDVNNRKSDTTKTIAINSKSIIQNNLQIDLTNHRQSDIASSHPSRITSQTPRTINDGQSDTTDVLDENSYQDFNFQNDTATINPSKFLSNENIIVNTDAMIESTHFFFDSNPEDVAKKIIRINISDIISSGGEAQFYSLSVSFPSTDYNQNLKRLYPLDKQWIENFISSIKQENKFYNLILLGGDTSFYSGEYLHLTITMFGKGKKGQSLSRSNSQLDNDIYCSGYIGDAGLWTKLVYHYTSEDNIRKYLTEDKVNYLKQAYYQPKISTELAYCLTKSNLIDSMMDISDGLLIDVKKLTAPFNLGSSLIYENIPISSIYQQVINDVAVSNDRSGKMISDETMHTTQQINIRSDGKTDSVSTIDTTSFGMTTETEDGTNDGEAKTKENRLLVSDLLKLHLYSGDDYQLLFTANKRYRSEIQKIAETTNSKVTRIGRVTAGRNIILKDNAELQLDYEGYIHS